MSDLIKRIESIKPRLKTTKQACADDGFNAKFTQVFKDADTLLHDCKAALEAKGEPVAYITQAALESITSGRCSSARVWANPRSRFDDITLYTTPPSVDALIAEIDGLTVYSFFTVQPILDKYRSAK